MGVGDDVAIDGPHGRYIYVEPTCNGIASSESVKLHLMQYACWPSLVVSAKVLLSFYLLAKDAS